MDYNCALLEFLERLMAEAGWELHTAETDTEARKNTMTGAMLAPEDEAVCDEVDVPVLREPFLATEVSSGAG